MRSIICQSIVLPAPASLLFDMYMDASRHAAFTGHPVTIGEQSGAEFRAFDDMLTGTILIVVRPRLIVQSWRSLNFHGDDPDSTLILSFSDQGEEGRIDLVHLDVPESDYDGVTEGWGKFYWTPWRDYLNAQ
jgi:activator of HSP90 ATPase